MKSRDARATCCSSSTARRRPIALEGVTRDAMMSRIHARDAERRWLRGIDVFAAVYRAAGLPCSRASTRPAALRPLFDRLYPWIADHRQTALALRVAALVPPRALEPRRATPARAAVRRRGNMRRMGRASSHDLVSSALVDASSRRSSSSSRSPSRSSDSRSPRAASAKRRCTRRSTTAPSPACWPR